MRDSGTGQTPRGGDASACALYVQIVIDVASVLQGNPPSAGAPTKVAFDPAQFIATTTDGAAASRKGVITLEAGDGDTIRFYAVSGSDNFEDAVLISEIGAAAGDPILDDFRLVERPSITVVPVVGAQPPSAATVKEDFWFWQSAVIGEGTRRYRLVFALYDRDDRGQPHFVGLYQWNLELKVQCNSTSTTGQNEEESS